RFADAADAIVNDARRHFLGADLLKRLDDRFRRALDIGLDKHRKLLAAAFLELRHHLLERRAPGGDAALVAPLALAIGGDLACATLAVDDHELITCLGRGVEAQNLGWNRRASVLHLRARVI